MPNRPYLGRSVDDAIAMYKPHISGTQGAVSANNPYAAQAGLEILKQGGTLSTLPALFRWCWGWLSPITAASAVAASMYSMTRSLTPSMRWTPVVWHPKMLTRTCFWMKTAMWI